MSGVKDLGPLSWNVPIVDVRSGRPSPEFQRRWNTQRGNDRLIGGSLASTTESGNFVTSEEFNCYFVSTAAGAVTVTLNPDPAQNEFVEVFDADGFASTHPISFNGGGKNIQGVPVVTNYINIDYGHARLVYSGTQWYMH